MHLYLDIRSFGYLFPFSPGYYKISSGGHMGLNLYGFDGERHRLPGCADGDQL